MATISSLVVSETVLQNDHLEDVDTPTTPRASRQSDLSASDATTFPLLQPSPSPKLDTPTQPSHPGTDNYPQVMDDQHSHSTDQNEQKSDEMELDNSDHELDISDNDGEPGDEDSASKKKKGQRFFCTGYPPCNLSFTRSEHLARHIRKHTGERPFQCHCNRRFSRLDNLRQHAQTVHVNEEIPTDSLAATGTRFQRQIRTDRVRPAGRPRTGSMSTTTSHSRGHSRNLSASSVGSTSSNYSTVTEAKRRPPPLLMANDNASRPKLALDPPSTPPSQYRGFRPGSPPGLSTPTSATFSATPGSPGYGSSIGSPISTNSRMGGFFGSRTPGRRLSVPSAPNPFQSHYSTAQTPPYMMHMPPPGSQSSANSSLFASPTSSTFAYSQGHHVLPSEDWRRRTWHPSSYSGNVLNYGRPATSGLTYSQTPDAPQPAFAQHATAAAARAPRLPGIESFDHFQHRPATPPRRPSPMLVDSHHTEPYMAPGGPNSDPRARPSHSSWTGPSTGNYSEFDPHAENRKVAGSWGQQMVHQMQNVGNPINEPQNSVEMAPPMMNHVQLQQAAQEGLQIQSPGLRTKRQAWYNGPVPATRTSPEDSSSSDGVPTPGTSAADVHPIIMHSNGFMEAQHSVLPSAEHHTSCLPHTVPSPYTDAERPRTITFADRNPGSGDTNRLEALVAVATSRENNTSSARY